LPSLAELEAELAVAEAAFKASIRELVLDVGEEQAERVMRAVNDGVLLGWSDAVSEALPPTEWKPGESKT
jgi:hypothetical protein